MGSIAQHGTKRNRNLRYAYENGHLTVQETINGATVTRLTTDFGEHLRELYRRYGYDVNAKRLKEIERLILARYGGPVDLDDGHAYLSAGMNARAMSWQHRRWKLAPGVLMSWARKWTPLVPEADVRKLAERVCAGPRKLKGATVGGWMRVSPGEKENLGLTTIDRCDADPETLAREKKDSRRDADRERKASGRRAKGMTPQGESVRALCRRYGLTAGQERTLRGFRGQKVRVEGYLAKRGVDKEGASLFVRLLVSRTTIGIEDTSNHADKKRGLEPAAAERGPVSVLNDSQLSQDQGVGDVTADGPDAAGGRSSGAQGPTRPSSLIPELDNPVDHDRPMDRASTDACPPRAEERPRAAGSTPAATMPVSGPESPGNGDPGDDGEYPSAAFQAAQRADARARERGDTIDAGQLLWLAAANASPPVPVHIREADDDTLGGHMLAMGHLTEAELARIMARPRQGRAA